MKRPNRSAKTDSTASKRFAAGIFAFTYLAVTAVLICSLGLLLSLPLWDDPQAGRRLALTLCHSSFRLAVLGVVSGLITDIAEGYRRQ